MGTTWSAKLVVAPSTALRPLHDLLQQMLDRVVAQMSTWEPDSELSRFNRVPPGTWHRLSDDFARVMHCALRIGEQSEGAFDPAMGALVQAWGFGAGGGQPSVPARTTLDVARSQPRAAQLLLCEHTSRLFQPGGVQLDLSAIAKGYAVDLLIQTLAQRGITDALVEVGGELCGQGRKPDGSPWRVLVETGADEHSTLPPRVLALDGIAVATSGDRWHRFEQDGVRYAHTLDPRSGHPVPQAAAAVTVVASTAMEADAWATALTVMGADRGLRFAQDHKLAARLVTHTATGPREQMSDAFAALLEH